MKIIFAIVYILKGVSNQSKQKQTRLIRPLKYLFAVLKSQHKIKVFNIKSLKTNPSNHCGLNKKVHYDLTYEETFTIKFYATVNVVLCS